MHAQLIILWTARRMKNSQLKAYTPRGSGKGRDVLQQALHRTPGGPVGHHTNCGNHSSAYTDGKMPSCYWNQTGLRCKTCLARCRCPKPLNSHFTGWRRNICIRSQSTGPQRRDPQHSYRNSWFWKTTTNKFLKITFPAIEWRKFQGTAAKTTYRSATCDCPNELFFPQFLLQPTRKLLAS